MTLEEYFCTEREAMRPRGHEATGRISSGEQRSRTYCTT